MDQRRSAAGIVLIVLGAMLLLGQWFTVGGEGVLAMIGAALLAAYAVTGQYGFLVPGGIMTGLGLGIIYENRVQGQGAPVLLGLGLGFVAIFAIHRLRGIRWPADWWPLIPGSVLTLIGLLLAARLTGVLGAVGRWWPLVLIGLGIWLLVRREEPGRTVGGASLPAPPAPMTPEGTAPPGGTTPPAPPAAQIRRSPTGAIILIGIGVAFLLQGWVGGNILPAVVLVVLGLALLLRDRPAS